MKSIFLSILLALSISLMLIGDMFNTDGYVRLSEEVLEYLIILTIVFALITYAGIRKIVSN
ncbi:MAG: hypothetical protein RXQ80_03500 [Sulfolobaceae archaeon]